MDARRAVTFSFRVSRRRARSAGRRARARERRQPRSRPGTPPPRAGRRDERLLERPDRVRRRPAGPLLVPAHRLRRQRRDGAQRRRGRRRPRRLRPLRQHLPGPRRATTTAARNAASASGRAGHSHQGQDVFARCGTPLVAARGGRVKFKQYHAAAGHYLVIDGAGTDEDYVYMHLAEASPFSAGDRVYTGQRIGAVGDTGNARGCHLHFELWSGPGWYDGGKPVRPAARRCSAWDAWSLAAPASRARRACGPAAGGRRGCRPPAAAPTPRPRSGSCRSRSRSRRRCRATRWPRSRRSASRRCPSTIVSTIPMRWRPGFSSRANRPTKRPQTTQVTNAHAATLAGARRAATNEEAHWPATRSPPLEDIPDVSGDYPGEMRIGHRARRRRAGGLHLAPDGPPAPAARAATATATGRRRSSSS